MASHYFNYRVQYALTRICWETTYTCGGTNKMELYLNTAYIPVTCTLPAVPDPIYHEECLTCTHPLIAGNDQNNNWAPECVPNYFDGGGSYQFQWQSCVQYISSSSTLLSTSTLSPSDCTNLCANGGYDYCLIGGAGNCYGTYGFDTLSTVSTCDVPCVDDSNYYCGGTDSFLYYESSGDASQRV